mmetsp:Transcript_3757/g.9586  ORF Transcript_3757/g.9586 Transcript_3757/m.9586 type:complete len:116 (-) Transcript_3757:698-1045(-)
MVILEAAAITAGGVAAYKGGKAAAVATAKNVKTKLKLSNQEKERKETSDSRKQERKERFSKINEYRNSLKDVNGNKKGGVAVPSFNWKSDNSKSSSSASSSAYSPKPSSGNWWEK